MLFFNEEFRVIMNFPEFVLLYREQQHTAQFKELLKLGTGAISGRVIWSMRVGGTGCYLGNELRKKENIDISEQ